MEQPWSQEGRAAPASALGWGLRAWPCPTGSRRGLWWPRQTRRRSRSQTATATALCNLAELYHPVKPPAPLLSHQDPSIPPRPGVPMDEWAKASSPTGWRAGRSHCTTHSHDSFHLRLISEPACAEEMMRGDGGCRKTLAELSGTGHGAQSEITLAPRTAGNARGTGGIPAQGHAGSRTSGPRD